MGGRHVQRRSPGRHPAERLQWDALSPALGFCTVTDAGPVQALYRAEGHGRRVFEGVARVGA